MPELLLALKFNQVLISMSISLGEMPPTCTCVKRAEIHKAFDAKSIGSPLLLQGEAMVEVGAARD